MYHCTTEGKCPIPSRFVADSASSHCQGRSPALPRIRTIARSYARPGTQKHNHNTFFQGFAFCLFICAKAERVFLLSQTYCIRISCPAAVLKPGKNASSSSASAPWRGKRGHKGHSSSSVLQPDFFSFLLFLLSYKGKGKERCVQTKPK